MRQAIVILTGSALLLFGTASGFFSPARGADHADVEERLYELQVVVDGDVFYADFNLTAQDCEIAQYTTRDYEVVPGVWVTITPDSETYCVEQSLHYGSEEE